MSIWRPVVREAGWMGAVLLLWEAEPRVRAEPAEAVSIATNYYSIAGGSLSELLRSQAQQRPWRNRHTFAARTEWQFSWTMQYRADGGRYRVTRFEGRTKVRVTLPRWTPPEGVDGVLVERWKAYFRALSLHEQGHVELARQAAEDARRAVAALAGYDSAEALRRAVQEAVDGVQAKYRRREREYDRQTRHGATQGAVLHGQ